VSAYASSAAGAEGRIRLHKYQLEFVQSKANITVALAGIRSGKTEGGGYKTLLHAIQNPCAEDEVHLVASPTYGMSKVPVQKIFKILYDKTIFPFCPLIDYIKSERMFILSAVGGGITRLQVVSLHDPDKIRGIKALSAWLDEGAYMTQDAWDVVIGRLADSNGPCWITTTPAGYNFIHELYERALGERYAAVPILERSIRFIHWSSLDNPFISAKGIARLASTYDPRTYSQEVKGLFIKASGLVYYPFNRNRNVVKYKLDKAKPVWIGQDFNVSAMASSFQQDYMNRDGKEAIAVFHERLVPGNTFELSLYLNKWCSANDVPRSHVTVVPDASGAARTTAGKSDHQILRQAGYKVESPKRNPFVKDRINCVNGLLDPMGAAPRLTVDPECPEHIKTFSKQIWKEDSDPPEPDKEHGLDHMGDACGYRAWRKHPLRMSAGLGRTLSEIKKRKAA
jgi:hypothetical protein